MKSLFALALLLFIWPFSSGKTYHMVANSNVPAANGTVHVQKGGENGNTQLDIKVSNLALPPSLTPPENVYIVWVRPNGGAAIKQGAISVNSDLNGELKTVTTAKNCDVFITAEPSPSVSMPTGMEVLHTHITVK